ncbi:AAA family ATPase [Proteiniclasticum ruminis]|uniref:AAA family ATPase n=1 Tax=Proteiniclasticum ruminis TaxID=398199 RepID=UPI0028AF6A14|nr:AAA family ATPase [Proteiniclasticum ruminis]
MINKVKVENFKSLNNVEVELSNFNLLIGTNSSGKSSLIQALLLVSQNIRENYGLNGPLVTLGDFREIKSLSSSGDKISIEIYDDSNMVKVEVTDSKETVIKVERILDNYTNLQDNIENLHFLSCNRIGVRDIYEKNLYEKNDFGNYGEYAIEYINRHKLDELEESLIKYKTSYTYSQQINYWLKYIINAEIKVEDIIGTDVVRAAYSISNNIYHRPRNVGSGISYLISIISLCLASKKEDIIVIENPEIHLHPLSQSRLTEFLYFIAKNDRQLIIETHSDHIFNGVRAGIAIGEIIPTKISINFVSIDDKSNTSINNIYIGKRGKVLNPHKDLFDQFELDLDKMLGLYRGYL